MKPGVILVAGTGSGVGKTSIAVGLARALADRSFTVQPFKTGPDFLDPVWLTRAARRSCVSLDGWMCGKSYVCSLAETLSRDADIILVEGVMGMYDGADPGNLAGSSAEIAVWLDASVLLVINVHGSVRSTAAIARGFADFEPAPGVAMVIANQAGSSSHADMLATAFAAPGCPPLAGVIPRGALSSLSSRHLGLAAPDHDDRGASAAEETIGALASAVEKHIQIDLILSRINIKQDKAVKKINIPPSPSRYYSYALGSAPSLLYAPYDKLFLKKPDHNVKIGIALDEAFSFYYPDNLEAIKEAGAELVPFSPLHDNCLPENLDGIYLGGGYPELHAEKLSENTGIKNAITAFAGTGHTVYAECGGIMYLSRGITTVSGNFFLMCGILPFAVRMSSSLRRLGYVSIKTEADCIWGKAGTEIRGHEFHYSEIDRQNGQPDFTDCSRQGWTRIYSAEHTRTGRREPEGFYNGCVLASYVHLHFASQPACARSFVEFCARKKSLKIPPVSSSENIITLRSGFTTGSAAAAAALAAAVLIAGRKALNRAEIIIPGKSENTGESGILAIPVAESNLIRPGAAASAVVIKDAGDDPDITDRVHIRVLVEHTEEPGRNILFQAGEGVGIVTKPGLQIPPGEPAINPVPRAMITDALRSVLPEGSWRITVSAAGGENLALKTFNPRLGITGGISILGTTGIVRPFSHSALKSALRCAFNVALASGADPLVLVPGNIGRRAFSAAYPEFADDHIIDVSNEWGTVLEWIHEAKTIKTIAVCGHPGKLTKLLGDSWDTHSSRSPSALPLIFSLAREAGINYSFDNITTAEGFFTDIKSDEREKIANLLAQRICDKIKIRCFCADAAVLLCDMNGKIIGSTGSDIFKRKYSTTAEVSAGGRVSHIKDETRKIVIAGCGPGSHNHLTAEVIEAVKNADVLIGTDRVLELFSESKARKITCNGSINAVCDIITREDAHRVCVLVTGDPGFYSLASLVVRRFGARQCIILPGITSVQAAAARLGISWAHALLLSAHTKIPQDTEIFVNDRELPETLIILGGCKDSPEWITRLGQRLGSKYRGWLCENICLPDERITAFPGVPQSGSVWLVIFSRCAYNQDVEMSPDAKNRIMAGDETDGLISSS